MSSANLISSGCIRSCARPWFLTAATCMLRIRCGTLGSPTIPLAADTRRVLVTGGAGYIGSHTCKALSQAGYTVVAFDNLLAGHREAVRYGPLVEGDILDTRAVQAALRQHQITAVMHFAALLD